MARKNIIAILLFSTFGNAFAQQKPIPITAPDGIPHGIVSSWAHETTKKREWEKYPHINIVMLDETMEWWKPAGNSYTVNWTSIDKDIKYITGLGKKFAFHMNYDYPHGYGHTAETQQGADWIYEQISAAGAPFKGVGGARSRGMYPAWYWHREDNWPWKKMYGWLIKEEAYHLRTAFKGECVYVRGQFNAADPENMTSKGAKDVSMAQKAVEDYAAWCANTYWEAFMNEDPAFWKGHDVSKLAPANRIQVMFKPKDGVEKIMEQKKFGVFLTHGSPNPELYELFEEFCRNKKLPGADEPTSGSGMQNPKMFENQHWYHLMALHSGFTTVSMRPGQYMLPNNPAISPQIKAHFTESVNFVNKYLGYLHYPEQSPGGWIAFRQMDNTSTDDKDKGNAYPGNNAGNWNFHITQSGSEKEINEAAPGVRNIGDLFYGLYVRKLVKPVRLNITNNLFGNNLSVIKINVTAFADKGPAVIRLRYHEGSKEKTQILNFSDVSTWATKTVTASHINFLTEDDLVLELVSGNAYIHMIELER